MSLSPCCPCCCTAHACRAVAAHDLTVHTLTQCCVCARVASILRLADEAGGAARKGDSRVRGFGGVPTFPVVKRLCVAPFGTGDVPGLSDWIRCACRCDFRNILTVWSVGRRHHKPPLRGGCASGRRGQVAGGAAPGRARKKAIFELTALFQVSMEKWVSARFPTGNTPLAQIRGPCPSLPPCSCGF